MPKKSLEQIIAELEEIILWFDKQEKVDLEEGIKKVKKGMELAKESRARLEEIENEFIDINTALN